VGTDTLHTQELLFAEIVFGVLSKVYLDAISAKYKGYAQWSLPLPISPSAESFINAVLFSGVLLPMGITLYCSTVGMMFVYVIVCVCTVGIIYDVCVRDCLRVYRWYYLCVLCPVWVWCGVCACVDTSPHASSAKHTHTSDYLSICLSIPLIYPSSSGKLTPKAYVCARAYARKRERAKERACVY